MALPWGTRPLLLILWLVVTGAVGFAVLYALSGTTFLSEPAFYVGGGVIGSYGTIAMALAARLFHLDHLVYTDDLTGSFNHRFLRRFLEDQFRLYARTGTPVGLILMDLDDFKHCNDRHGHLAGDRLLQLFSQQLLGLADPGCPVVRYGGDEFVIILPGRGAVETGREAERLSAVLARSTYRLPEPVGEVRLSASVGWASCPAHGTTFDELLRQADATLYRHKRGGNQVAGSEDG